MSEEMNDSKPRSSTDEGDLLPQDAAELLAATEKKARHDFQARPPYLLGIGGALFLVALGAIWISVRHQHPYQGPTGTALVVLYGCIIVWVLTVIVVVQRAVDGVSGKSMKRRKTEGWGYAIVYVAVYVFQGALYHAGAGKAVAFGVYPASAPWLFAGTVFATIGIQHEDRRGIYVGIAMVALGLFAAFTGPVTSWLISAVGLCLVLWAFAVFQVIQRRRHSST